MQKKKKKVQIERERNTTAATETNVSKVTTKRCYSTHRLYANVTWRYSGSERSWAKTIDWKSYSFFTWYLTAIVISLVLAFSGCSGLCCNPIGCREVSVTGTFGIARLSRCSGSLVHNAANGIGFCCQPGRHVTPRNPAAAAPPRSLPPTLRRSLLVQMGSANDKVVGCECRSPCDLYIDLGGKFYCEGGGAGGAIWGNCRVWLRQPGLELTSRFPWVGTRAALPEPRAKSLGPAGGRRGTGEPEPGQSLAHHTLR